MKTETKRKFLIDFAFFVIIIAAVYFAFKFLLAYLLPFVIGISVSFLVQRPVKFICKKLSLPKGPLTTVFVIFAYALLAAVIGLIIFLLYRWLSGIANMLPALMPEFTELWQEFNGWLNAFLKNMPSAVSEYIAALPQKLAEAVGSLTLTLSDWVLGIVTAIPSHLISTIVTIVASCYIAYDYDRIIAFVKARMPKNAWLIIIDVKDTFFTTIFKMLKSYALLMLITFSELAIGFLIMGQSNALLLAAIICVVDILPVLGTGTVLIPWALIHLLAGDILPAIGLIVIYVVITVIRNFLEPKIIGNQVGLHPLLTLLSMFIGLNLMGILGLFAFPIILIVISELHKKGRIRIPFLDKKPAKSSGE